MPDFYIDWVLKKQKPTGVATVSKTETEQVLKLILQLSLLICFRVFRVDAQAFG